MIAAPTQSPTGPATTPAGLGRRRVGMASRLKQRIRWGDDEGTSPIELAILMPAIIIALFSSIQVATYFIARTAALAAAQEAVSVQRVYGAQPGAGQQAAVNLIASGGAGDFLDDAKIYSPQTTADGTGITVKVTGKAPSLIWLGFSITVTAHGTLEAPSQTPVVPVEPAPPGPPTVP